MGVFALFDPLEGQLSTVATLGVPRGSPLSPFLFGIYTSDIPTTAYVNLAIYGDDACIFARSLDTRIIDLLLQAALDTLQAVLFSRGGFRRRRRDNSTELTFQGSPESSLDHNHFSWTTIPPQSTSPANHHPEMVVENVIHSSRRHKSLELNVNRVVGGSRQLVRDEQENEHSTPLKKNSLESKVDGVAGRLSEFHQDGEDEERNLCRSQVRLRQEEGKWLVRIVGEYAEADRHILFTTKSQLKQLAFTYASKSITGFKFITGCWVENWSPLTTDGKALEKFVWLSRLGVEAMGLLTILHKNKQYLQKILVKGLVSGRKLDDDRGKGQ
ncbi:hypothetical protein Trydic_g12335 [Trypoxylus dichotomus]